MTDTRPPETEQEAFVATVFNIQKRISEWTEARIEIFIEQLILSGDIFLLSGPDKFITENTVDKTKKINISARNLVCYEPFHLRKELEKKSDYYKYQADKLADALEAVRSEMCWEADRDQLSMGFCDLFPMVTKALAEYQLGKS